LKNNKNVSFILKSFQENRLVYTIIILTFVISLCFGTYISNTLDKDSEDELSKYIDSFFSINEGLENNISKTDIFLTSLFNNTKLITILWLFSITYLGIPITILIIMIKGYSLGFTTGFLIRHLKIKGISFSFFNLLPKNIIEIPVYVILAAICINYSISLNKDRFRRKTNVSGTIWNHTIKIFALYIILSLSSVIEAYFSTIFIGFFVK
jgi:stage II sporulation protein M